MLEDTSIELEVEAADDFGLREMGVEWQGEKSFYDDEEENTAAPDPAKAGKPVPGLRGEKVLADGHPTQASLKGTYLFQARALKLSPPARRRARVHAGLQARGKRVYSNP